MLAVCNIYIQSLELRIVLTHIITSRVLNKYRRNILKRVKNTVFTFTICTLCTLYRINLTGSDFKGTVSVMFKWPSMQIHHDDRFITIGIFIWLFIYNNSYWLSCSRHACISYLFRELHNLKQSAFKIVNIVIYDYYPMSWSF